MLSTTKNEQEQEAQMKLRRDWGFQPSKNKHYLKKAIHTHGGKRLDEDIKSEKKKLEELWFNKMVEQHNEELRKLQLHFSILETFKGSSDKVKALQDSLMEISDKVTAIGRFQTSAIDALQESIEAYLVYLLEDTILSAIPAKL
ncbi:hypothetical protein BDR22DRAFT_969312 [Usnea florida]